jgi:Xaa-Pro aminopeptidase
MLFELHPNLFVQGVGGACVGDMVVVTAEGNEALTKFPRGLIDWTA